MFLSDHQMRQEAIRTVGFIIECREDYLGAVRYYNQDFVAAQGRIWKQYLREPVTRKPYGLVVIYKKDGKVVVSGSALHKGDKWDKQLALFYAINRVDPAFVNLVNGSFDPKKLPRSCFDVAANLVDEYLAKNPSV